MRALGICLLRVAPMASLLLGGLVLPTTASAAARAGGQKKEALPAPPAAARDGKADELVKGTREVVLDEKAAGKVHPIRTARNVLTTVEFPEDLLGRPACGDCETDQGPEGDALYRMAVSAQGRYLTLRPNASGRRPKDGDTSTTILVRLEHATLTLFVDQGERARADTRVVFTNPNRTSDTEFLRVERARIEAEAGAKVEAGFRARMLRAMAEPHGCVRKGERRRSEDLVLEVSEMCYFGNDVFLSFSLENRGRTPLEVGSVVVSRGTSSESDLSGHTVEGDNPSIGTVSVHLNDGEAVKGPYELTIHEKGGKERVISVSRLQF